MFNRPSRKNAITDDMYLRLTKALEQAKTDPAIRAVLFTGSGDAFTGGMTWLNSPRGTSTAVPARTRWGRSPIS